MGRPDRAALAQFALLAAGELSWLWAWSHALGMATLRAPVALVPAVALMGLFAVGALVRAGLVRRVGPALMRPLRWTVAAALVVGTAEIVWWRGAGGAAPWQVGGLPLTDDALLLRGLTAGALVWVAWWRGAALPWPRPTLSRVEGAFRVWMQALGALFLLTTALRELYVPLAAPLLTAAIVPLAAGLAGMPLARVFDIRRERDPDGRVPARVGRQWGWILGSSVGGLLLAAFVLARALVAGLLTTVARWLERPASLVGSAVDWLLALWAAVWTWLMRSTPEEGSSLDLPEEVMARGMRDTPPAVREGAGDLDWLMSLVSAIAAALLTVLLWHLMTRARERIGLRTADDGVEEERDFVWPSLDRALGLRSLSHLLDSLRPTRRARRTGGVRLDKSPAERVRRLYRQLLVLGERSGRPRGPDETPREYQAALGGITRFHASAPELDTLTSLYSQIRYGEAAPEPESVASAERALRRIKAVR